MCCGFYGGGYGAYDSGYGAYDGFNGAYNSFNGAYGGLGIPGIMGIAGGIMQLVVLGLIVVTAVCAIRWFVKKTDNKESR